MIEVRETGLDGVLEIVPQRFVDPRGWFRESWNREAWFAAGIGIEWVQDNESVSAVEGTVRGIHFQREPFAQDKLFRVVRGHVLDVAVDLRRSSPTFGNHVAVELSAEVGNQLLVPKGFGHAFLTRSADCHVAYKVSAPYDREAEAAVQVLDPALGIDWQADVSALVMSDKDRNAPLLADASELLFD